MARHYSGCPYKLHQLHAPLKRARCHLDERLHRLHRYLPSALFGNRLGLLATCVQTLLCGKLKAGADLIKLLLATGERDEHEVLHRHREPG